MSLAVLPVQFKRLSGVGDMEDTFSITVWDLDIVIDILVLHVNTHNSEQSDYECLPLEVQE